MNRVNIDRVRLQDIFIRSGEEFRRDHVLSQVQLKAMKAIEQTWAHIVIAVRTVAI
jgi:hypothetical protein